MATSGHTCQLPRQVQVSGPYASPGVQGGKMPAARPSGSADEQSSAGH